MSGSTVHRKEEFKPVTGIQWYYLQYLLLTGLYMLEPWERKLFNSVILVGLTTAVFFLRSAFSSLV